MSRGLAIFHGKFGRAALYRLDRSMALHAHREGHLIFHVAGPPGRTQVAGEACELSQGWCAAVDPWKPHDFRATAPGDGGLYLVLYIEPAWFLELDRNARFTMRFGDARIPLDAQLRRLIDRLVTLLVEDDRAGLFEGYLLETARECFDRSWQWAPERAAADLHCVRDFRVRRSLRLMRERLTDETCLDEIARESGLSRPHFYKLFRQQVGVTPNLYLNTLRVETALVRLLRTEEPVTTIGLDLGFSSQASFTRFFVNNVGIPPTDYRRVARVEA